MFACIPLKGKVVAVVAALALTLALAAPSLIKMVPAEAVGTPLPIVMYHSILRDRARAGPYVLSPTVLEADFQYLHDRGYTAIFASELAEAVLSGAPLPEKPVMITFDDGQLNNLTYALPLLEKYNMKAVVSVVGSYSEKYSEQPDHNPTYAYLTWEDITTLADSKRVEIGNHTYDMHRQTPRKGTRRKKGESANAYYAALLKDVGRTQSLLENCCGIVPTTFTYPFGQISPESIPILQEMGFTTLLTCNERINYLSGDPAVLLSLGRFNRPSGVSTEKFMKKLGIGA